MEHLIVINEKFSLEAFEAKMKELQGQDIVIQITDSQIGIPEQTKIADLCKHHTGNIRAFIANIQPSVRKWWSI